MWTIAKSQIYHLKFNPDSVRQFWNTQSLCFCLWIGIPHILKCCRQTTTGQRRQLFENFQNWKLDKKDPFDKHTTRFECCWGKANIETKKSLKKEGQMWKESKKSKSLRKEGQMKRQEILYERKITWVWKAACAYF